MKNTEFKKYLNILLAILVTLLFGSMVIILMFRTQVLVNGLHHLVSILKPFIYGAAIAYLLHPVSTFFESLLTRLDEKLSSREHPGLVRTCSILLSMALVLAVVVLLVLTVIPQLITSVTGIVSQLPKMVTDFQSWLETMDKGESSHEAILYLGQIIDTLGEQLQKFLETVLLPNMKTFISEITSSFLILISFLKNFGIGLIVASYILGSWERFLAQAKLVVYGVFPEKWADWIKKEVHYADHMFSGFINGKLLDPAIIGLICFVFCSIVKMPYAMLVSIIVGVTNIIPFFGPYLGAIPSAILILMVNPYKCIVFLIFIIILQQIDGNILGPRILGDKMGVSGFWVLFSILFFGSLWGLVGMLIGVPVFAVIYDLLRQGILFGLRKRNQIRLLENYQERFAKAEEIPKKKQKQ